MQQPQRCPFVRPGEPDPDWFKPTGYEPLPFEGLPRQPQPGVWGKLAVGLLFGFCLLVVVMLLITKAAVALAASLLFLGVNPSAGKE